MRNLKLLVLCLFPLAQLFSQTGKKPAAAATPSTAYAIQLTLKPLKNVYVYLGYHYGAKKALADSVLLDANSQGTFKGKEPLPGGIYFIVSPRKEILFECLIDKQQRFSITADTLDLTNSVKFTGSPDNAMFQRYTQFASRTGSEGAQVRAQLANAKNASDSAAINTRLQIIGQQVQQYRDSILQKFPETILSAFFRVMRDPVIPPAASQPGGKYDTNYVFNYYKSHYWDGVSFDDERLIRTPFFENKLQRYFRDLVVPAPDSIFKEVDHILLYSRSNKEAFKFYMVHFVQKYVNPEFMGQDAVFVSIWEKYINTGQTDFFTEQYKDFMTKRAYSLMANLIGQPAAVLDLVDTADKPARLYDLKAELTIVCFWDPTCGHCKETVPRVDSMYQSKWKQQGVKVFGVMTDGGKDNWTQFIREHKLTGWVHAYQTEAAAKEIEKAGKPGYKQLYDVYQTPILYLLDKDKRIVAKKLSFEQLDEIITLKLKQQNSPDNGKK